MRARDEKGSRGGRRPAPAVRTFGAGLAVTAALGAVAAGHARVPAGAPRDDLPGAGAAAPAALAPEPRAAPADSLARTLEFEARPHSDPVVVERTVVRMGTTLRGRARAADRPAAAAALEVAFRAVRAEERLLSTWREDTELARLNRAPVGAPRRVAGRLHRLLAEAWGVSAETDGAFDPVVGALVDAWDLRGEGRRPSDEELRRALAASGRGCFAVGAGRRVTRRCDGAWIDGGAFGKGSALERARRALEETGTAGALLDFGGQLLAVGSPPGGDAWPAAVAHPADRGRALVRLRLRDRSAATTASSERFVVVDGEPRGHVLDPRTGRPVPSWGSVTVIGRDPLRADALATALFVMGPDRAMDWAEGRGDVGVLVLALEEDGGVAACWNDAMDPYLTSSRPERRSCRDAS